MANPLCPGQRKHTMHEFEVQIGNSVYRVWGTLHAGIGSVFLSRVATENGTESARPRAPIRDILFGARSLNF